MSKRAPADLGDGHEAYLKRQKLSHGVKATTAREEIQSSRQLQQLLAFDQDAGRAKHGMCATRPYATCCEFSELSRDELEISE